MVNIQIFAIGKDNQLYHLWTDPDPYHWGNDGQWAALGQQIEIKKRKIGLALGGGASKGDFQLGVLKYLYEVKMILPYLDIICATSVGAINGIKLAEGDESSLLDLERIWDNLIVNSDMYKPEQWIDNLSHDLKDSFLKMIGISMLMGLVAIPFDIISINKMTDEAKNAFKNNSSLNNLDPINQKLRNNVNVDKLAASKIRFQVSAVSLESGQLHFIEKINQVGKGSIVNDGRTVDIIDAVLASASEPVIFKPVVMADQHFVDGGLREQVPIKNTIDMGADKVFAIQLSPPLGPLSSQDDALSKLIGVTSSNKLDILNILARTVDILSDEVTNNDVILPAGYQGKADTMRIQPSFEVHSGLRIDPGMIAISKAYGYMRAFDVIDAENYRYSAEQTDKIIQTRKQIWSVEEEILNIEDVLRVPPDDKILKYAQDSISRTRTLKKNLKSLLDERVKSLRAVLPGFDTWPYNWEKHYRPNQPPLFPSSPWDELTMGYSSPDGSTAYIKIWLAATPP
jgi:predicted acylesterase/phospholipase RssA